MTVQLVLLACALAVLCATGELVIKILEQQPLIWIPALVVASLFIAAGLLRRERLTWASTRNLLPLIVAGIVSLILVTLLRGSSHIAVLMCAGGLCLGASCWTIAIEKGRRLLAVGVQLLVLLYDWGLVFLWGMAIWDDWL